MRITVIHGQMHHGSTYEVTKQLVSQVSSDITHVTEFFLPKDMPYPCVGCFNCFTKGEETCPHYELVQPIVLALEKSDLIVLESPCYVFGMSGQMKVLLDHLAYRWMSHRPHPDMFNKVGLVVSTAAGAGAKKVTKDLAQNLFFGEFLVCINTRLIFRLQVGKRLPLTKSIGFIKRQRKKQYRFKRRLVVPDLV